MGITELLIRLETEQENLLKRHLPILVYPKYVERRTTIKFLREYLDKLLDEGPKTTEEKITQMLKENGPMKRRDIANKLNVSLGTISYYCGNSAKFVTISRGVVGLRS